MRHIVYHQAREFYYDTATLHTHAVLAQLSESHHRPPPAAIPKKPTPEEFVALKAHVIAMTHGKFARKVVAWAASEAEAEEMAKAFSAPEWEKVKVVEIDQVIQYA